mgnify:CR=1 FL=1
MNNTPNPKPIPHPDPGPTATVVAVYDAFARGAATELADLLHPDVELHVPGQQPLAGFLRATTTLADVREELTVIDVLGSAERAAVLCHVTGHRAGEVVLDNLTVHVHRVADGRVAEIRFHNFDQMGVDAFWAA